jgi:hypothetical protein
MGRKGAGSPTVSPARQAAPWRAPFPRWPFSARRTALAVALLVLVGVVVFALTREMGRPGRAAGLAGSAPAAAKPPKPAFTAAEEAYIQALWPIHGQVERSAARMTLGQIFYKLNDMDRPGLKKRVDDALVTYRRSEAQLRDLTPPATIQRDHEEYLAAIQLFQQSAVEVLRMFEDGRDDHMLAAYPLGQKATDKIREVGGKFWPNEFAPN